ncbi:hypothetical protein DE146DRAFT_663911 [Phaeosphaeria sp. MPI-PUGE-AT-0046c]|nr:hypothetical protein DE146DRAFT_663911 [Phaeosphaeria sp. MPI-PUGE-AT-0046c]
MSRFIQSFRVFPVELFRVNHGHYVRLREWTGQRPVYDIHTQDGYVKAKAMDPTTYTPPNGASMRPDPQRNVNLIKNMRGMDIVVYSVPAGTKLPDDLILVHEFKEHYSLQPARDMHISDLDEKLTKFFQTYGNAKSKQAWLNAYERGSGGSSGF